MKNNLPEDLTTSEMMKKYCGKFKPRFDYFVYF